MKGKCGDSGDDSAPGIITKPHWATVGSLKKPYTCAALCRDSVEKVGAVTE